MDYMNWGEIKDEKSVLLVDVPAQGIATVTPIKLVTTPFYPIVINASELDDLSSRYLDLDRAFVTVEVKNDNNTDPASIYRIVREKCPRQTDIKITGGSERTKLPNLVLHPKSYSETVRGYLNVLY